MKIRKYIFSLVALIATFLFWENLKWASLAFASVGTSIWIPFLLLLAIIIFSIVLIINDNIAKKLKGISIFLILAICFSLSFYISPYYPEDYEDRNITILPNEYPTTILDSISSSKITCFFLVTCPHCENATKYLSHLYNKERLKDIEIVYYAHQQTADSLAKSIELKIPYSVIEDDTFFELAGSSFPAILVKETDNLKLWVGNDVNFACFDYLIDN